MIIDILNKIKEECPVGATIVLNNMAGEDMPKGLKGTIDFVDSIGQVHVNWENRSSLALRVDLDDFEIIK